MNHHCCGGQWWYCSLMLSHSPYWSLSSFLILYFDWNSLAARLILFVICMLLPSLTRSWSYNQWIPHAEPNSSSSSCCLYLNLLTRLSYIYLYTYIYIYIYIFIYYPMSINAFLSNSCYKGIGKKVMRLIVSYWPWHSKNQR